MKVVNKKESLKSGIEQYTYKLLPETKTEAVVAGMCLFILLAVLFPFILTTTAIVLLFRKLMRADGFLRPNFNYTLIVNK